MIEVARALQGGLSASCVVSMLLHPCEDGLRNGCGHLIDHTQAAEQKYLFDVLRQAVESGRSITRGALLDIPLFNI